MKKFVAVLFLCSALGSQSLGMMGEDEGAGVGPSRPMNSVAFDRNK